VFQDGIKKPRRFQKLLAFVDEPATQAGDRGTMNCAATPAPMADPELRCPACVSSWQPGSLQAASSKAILRLPLCHPFSSRPPRFWLGPPIETDNPAPRFHLVPPVQFQVLLTRLSTFFSTFLRSTFPLSVFVLYLDLAEVYQLLCAEITINATLKVELIWTRIMTVARGLSPSLVQLSY